MIAFSFKSLLYQMREFPLVIISLICKLFINDSPFSNSGRYRYLHFLHIHFQTVWYHLIFHHFYQGRLNSLAVSWLLVQKKDNIEFKTVWSSSGGTYLNYKWRLWVVRVYRVSLWILKKHISWADGHHGNEQLWWRLEIIVIQSKQYWLWWKFRVRI